MDIANNRLFKHVLKPIYIWSRDLAARSNDRRLGITTDDESVAALLGYGKTKPWAPHRALTFSAARRVLRRLAPQHSDGLIDFGCGAGRIVCVAAQYPFSRVVGIDIEKEWCSVAERNARTLRHFSVRPEIVCENAATYDIPDDISVVVFYNPFGEEVMRDVLARIFASYERAPRRLRLVYGYPVCHDLIMATKRFRQTGQMLQSWRPGADWRRTQEIRFYELNG